MHQNTPFLSTKVKHFLGERHSPQTSTTGEEEILSRLSLAVFGRSTGRPHNVDSGYIPMRSNPHIASTGKSISGVQGSGPSLNNVQSTQIFCPSLPIFYTGVKKSAMRPRTSTLVIFDALRFLHQNRCKPLGYGCRWV